MSFMVDMSLPPAELLLGLINQENPKANFTFDKVQFDPAGPSNTTLYGKDTLIYLLPLKGAGFIGKKAFYYNRINLADFLGPLGVKIEEGVYTETAELLPLVMSQLGINLTRADIYNDYIVPLKANESKIRISVRSIMYKGYVPVQVGQASMFAGVKNRYLDGFHKP